MSSGKDVRIHLPKKRIKLEELEGEPEPESILGDLNQDSDSDLSETWSEFGETLFKTEPGEAEEPEDQVQPYHEPEEETLTYEPPPDQEEPMEAPEVKPPQITEQPRKFKRRRVRNSRILTSSGKLKRDRRLKRLQNSEIKLTYEELPHVCSVCTRRFSSEKHLHSHLEKHQDTPTCPACPNSIKFNTMSDLKDHLLSCLSLPAFVGSIDLVQRPYLCIEPNCFKSYANKVTLGFHMKGPHFSSIPETKWDPNHSVKYVQKATNSDGPRPYICDECGASYKGPQGLYLHVKRVHLKIRYKCTFPGCDASLSDRSALNTHMAGIHAQSNQPKIRVRCKYPGCSKTLAKNSLNSHMKICHSKSKPFICEHCGITYKWAQGLESHIKSRHLNLKLDCTYPGCDRKFSHDNSLRIHLKSSTFHNSEKSAQDASILEKIVCQYCGLLYHPKAMKTHQRAKHFDLLSPEEQAEVLSGRILDEKKGKLVSKKSKYNRKMSQEERREARVRKILREGLQMEGETLDDTIARLNQEKRVREREELRAKREFETAEEREERRARYRKHRNDYVAKNRDKLNEWMRKYVKEHKRPYHKPTPEERAKANEKSRKRWARLTLEQKRWKNRKKSKDLGQSSAPE